VNENDLLNAILKPNKGDFMKKSLLLVFVVFAFFLSSAAFAADTKGYFALKGGIFDPNDKTYGMKDFNNGTNFEAAYGMKVHPNITLEFGAGYYRAKDNVWGLETASAIPLTLTALVNLPLGSVIDLNVGAGAGYYFTKFEIEALGVSKEVGEVGYQVVGGVDFKIDPAISIGAEAKYVYVNPEYNFTASGGGKGKVEMGGMMYNAVLKFKF